MTEPSYTPLAWADSPDTSTPIDAANLAHVENGVKAATDRAVASVRHDQAQSLPAANQAIGRGNLGLGDVAVYGLQETSARALGWAIVTDSRNSGGADPTGANDSTSAINAAINTVSTNGGTVFFPAGTYKITGTITVPAGVKLVGTTLHSSGGKLPTEISVNITGTGPAFSMAGTTALEGLGIVAFGTGFTGFLVSYSGATMGEITRCYLQATTAGSLLDLDQATHVECRKVNFVSGDVQVRGKATNSSYSNVHLFTECRWGGANTAAIKNAGQAWQIVGGAGEAGANGVANFYRHDAGVRGENFSIKGTWFGDVTATGPNQTIIWSGDNLSIRDSYCGWNDGTFLTLDENGCNGVVLDDNQYNAFNTHNPTYIVDFGTTSGHTGFQHTNKKIYTALTAETHGTTPVDSCFSLKPSPLDFGFTTDPRIGQLGAGAITANRTIYLRYRGGNGPITKVAVHIGVSSGNIAVAAYRNTGSGRAARPGAQLATSGSVACPAAGYNEIALTSTADIRDGDWLAIAADNATATFTQAGGNGYSSSLAQALSHFESAYPPPATATPSATNALYSFVLVAVP